MLHVPSKSSLLASHWNILDSRIPSLLIHVSFLDLIVLFLDLIVSIFRSHCFILEGGILGSLPEQPISLPHTLNFSCGSVIQSSRARDLENGEISQAFCKLSKQIFHKARRYSIIHLKRWFKYSLLSSIGNDTPLLG